VPWVVTEVQVHQLAFYVTAPLLEPRAEVLDTPRGQIQPASSGAPNWR
jgi:hypothetical protein